MNAARLESLFNRCFARSCHTVLRGGADEPVYTPAADGVPARIAYREDFVSSALHEVAHWCIAGKARLQQVDYGYWYAPDGRSPEEQLAFERAEARPQALEWLFAQSCGVAFSLSFDNLSGETDPAGRRRLACAVAREAEALRCGSLPPRARHFYRILREESRGGVPLKGMCFNSPVAISGAH
ncbi:MAG: elongation factor P hydroxylase [Chromatocurvus sp.]